MAEEMNSTAGGIRLEVNALSVVNYALQQNKVPAIRSVNILNETAQPLEHVELCVSASPALCLPYSKHFDFIPPDSTFSAGTLELQLDGAFLSSLTEKALGFLNITLTKDGEILCSQIIEVTALAFDEWHGCGFYPELLTAFVTPNHPEVTRLTARASQLLESWTGDPSLDGYMTRDPNRVLSQAAAVYGAIQEQNIVYSVPPASFETAGQRVRLCDAVMQQKMGTCLDLTLLYTACLEAIGLHPLLILKPGHIFAGVWLEELTFPEAVQDDPSLITKRLASGINEIAVVECTAMTAGRNIDFDRAQEAAVQHFGSVNAVEDIIDVHRSRLSGISPLPLRIATGNGWQILRPQIQEAKLTEAPQALGAAVETEELVAQGPLPKKVQWERKLLDLGMRNALINMRLSKSMIPILTDSLDNLENALTEGSDFTVLPRPADHVIPGGIRLDNMHELADSTELIRTEFKNRRLRSAYTEAELSKALKELYRTSKSSLEENGANTLYLALGLLRWFETPRSTKPRFAPIILLPVEMVRKSAAQGYVIRIRDEDPQMNITVLEKLKQDFHITVSGLDPLPTDEKGIDTRKVFTVLRKAVMGQARWDVLESAYLGIFSFSQFVMWNDIRNRSDDLSRNKIVRSLMDGKLCWEARDMTVGETVPEDGAFLPLSADASQLYAIEEACKGESFVLHGPPGTGKSQTITTMIANALAQGKSVLFVAEKMAALEVVQKRLTKIGIGPFCLELHSNKSKKRSVLDQLKQATEVTKNTSPEEYAARAEQIAGLRAELAAYAADLHKKGSCGKSLFQLVNGYEENKEAPDITPFSSDYVKTLTTQLLLQQDTLAERMVAAAKAVGHPHGHPLESVCCTQYSQQIRVKLPEVIAAYRAALGGLRDPLGAFSAAASLNASSYRDIRHCAEVAQELTVWLELPQEWAGCQELNRTLTDISQMADRYTAAQEQKQALMQNWTEDFLSQDSDALCRQWDETAEKWFLPRLTGQSGLLRRLKSFAKGSVDKESIRSQLADLAQYQEEKAAGDALFAACSHTLGNLYNGENTDYSAVRQAVQRARESLTRLNGLNAAGLRSAAAGNSQLIRQMLAAWQEFTAARTAVCQLLALSVDKDAPEHITEQERVCDLIRDNADSLKDWIAWNAAAEEAANLGMGELVDAYRNGLPHEQAVGAYRKAVNKALAMAAIDDSQALCTFSGAVFNEKIRQFKRIDEDLAKLTQQEIYCRLAARVPNFSKEAAHSSELGILQRAIRSGGRGISIRRLFEQIPNLLPRLCPCMLMSPISAAQYLEPNRAPFDLVVFDEASQLPTCKAVGALARGENAIIVGDPKQMPPTAFFVTNSVDEENLDTEDLESILDDCLALNIPQTHLLWHYRSRHESLIAFSNRAFYENKLYTFPSVNDRASKVRLVQVDGVFERSKQRQNRAEAQAVVEELKRRCHDEALSKYSVGVVTFNIAQQHLIDDLLQEACREDAALDAWAYQSAEPVFIKNLENVQGDERDVILFSVGYGPDETGKVYMNFGPLNRDGGWRRLNVAITRSRREMIVFSTLRSEQIDLSRTAAQGVAALKAFLEYAATQKLPQDENSTQKLREEKDGIAQSICEYLESKGYDTQRNVGHSEYRIDIGVVDPKNPEAYKLGILLDGESYGASKTVRDREIAQIGVLQGLGWSITRVWTMDWWDNSQRELERLVKLLEQPEQEPEEIPLPPIPEEAAVKLASPIAEDSAAAAYTSAQLKESAIPSEDFTISKHRAAIKRRIGSVMEAEAPISQGLLTRKVVQSFGITRAGSRIQSYMDALYDELGLYATPQGAEIFYWRKDQDPESYRTFRTAESEESRREVDDIPVQEAAAAVFQAVTDQFSLSGEDLIREGGKLLGYARLGNAITMLMKEAIRYAQWKGWIVQGPNGNWTLPKN